MLQGDALELGADPLLQAITDQALALVGGSWAAITLLLMNTVIVRAHSNMPLDLAGLLSLGSVNAFCAGVVQTGTRIAIEDVGVSADRTRFTRTRAYLGQPVSINGVVVGALCVHDEKPRSFDGLDLGALAQRAGERLSVLALRRGPSHRLFDLALRPAFAEIRNDLTPLQADLIVAQETLKRLASEAASARMRAVKSLDTMRESLSALQLATARLSENLSSLQVLCCGQDRAIVGEVVQAADELAYHHTNLIGGVHWFVHAPLAPLDVSQRTSVSVVTASLSMLALRLSPAHDRSGLHALVEKHADHVLFRLRGNLDAKTLRECATAVADLVHNTRVSIQSTPDTFQIVLPAA